MSVEYSEPYLARQQNGVLTANACSGLAWILLCTQSFVKQSCIWQWKDRKGVYLLGSPAKPTGKYVITVHTKDAAAEKGIRSRKAGSE